MQTYFFLVLKAKSRLLDGFTKNCCCKKRASR